MAKVIPIESAQKKNKLKAKPQHDKMTPHVQTLLGISDQFDEVILQALTQAQISPQEIAGLLAHRLGSLMRHMDEKEALMDICKQVIENQAQVS